MTPPRHERGAALLTVLLLVAVIGVIAATSLERLKLQTRLSINMALIDQARHYGYAGEAIAVSRLGDLAGPAARITLSSGLLDRPTPFPIDGGGRAVARVSDGGNCFNVNSLVSRGAADGALVMRPAGVRQFEALMLMLGVERNAAAQIAVASSDWIDSDSLPQQAGAEDETYIRAPIPYRAGNTLMSDPGELRAVRGVSPAIYERLKPWLCALPEAELSSLNVNTLRRDQAPLLAMLAPGAMTAAFAERAIADRPAGGYSTVEAFWSKPAIRSMSIPPEAASQTRVKTRWFTLVMQIELEGAEASETALIDAGRYPAKVVRRSWDDGA